MRNKIFDRSIVTGFTVALALGLTACGKDAVLPIASTQNSMAPGTFQVPPKIDILFGEEDEGAMFKNLNANQEAITSFLSSLDSQGWNYHFATVPLGGAYGGTAGRAMSASGFQVVGSKYDEHWGQSAWLAAYPGEIFSLLDPDMVNSSNFTTSANYTGFVPSGYVSNNTSGIEPGLASITNSLESTFPTSSTMHFLRPEAMTVMVVFSLGDDTSGTWYCSRSDDIVMPCDSPEVICKETGSAYTNGNVCNGQPVTCGTTGNARQSTSDTSCTDEYTSMDSYKVSLKNIGTASQWFYAAVNKTNCGNSQFFAGNRYQTVVSGNNALNGEVIDACLSSNLTNIFNDIQSNLASISLSYRTAYIQISGAPDVTQTVVTENVGGNNETVPYDPNGINGWNYIGDVPQSSPVPVVEYVNPSGISSTINTGYGYMIQLYGSYIMTGSTFAQVSFVPAGSQASSN